MGAAYHERYGGSPKHDTVPDEFVTGWDEGRKALLTEMADAVEEMAATGDLFVGDPNGSAIWDTKWTALHGPIDDPEPFVETLRKWAKEGVPAWSKS